MHLKLNNIKTKRDYKDNLFFYNANFKEMEIEKLEKKLKREKWLDYIKIMASFLVVILHTINIGLEENKRNIGLIFYYIGVFAIPLFFMVNGYLQLRKDKIKYSYCIKKIIKILGIVLIWNIAIAIPYLILKGEYKNFIYESIKNLFLQKGYYNHFWFLGTLIIIYIFLPLFIKIFNSQKRKYITITSILIITCMAVDILNIRNNLLEKKVIIDIVPQTFRMWTWITYFCIGGCLSRINIEKIKTKKLQILTIITTIGIVIYQYQLSIKLYGNLYAENFYDNFLVMLGAILIFILFKKINSTKDTLIEKIAPLTMGIYIIHLTVLNTITHFIKTQNNFQNLLLLPVVFGGSIIISYIIYKIPKINNIIKI